MPETPLCQVCFSMLAVHVEEIATAGRLDGHPPVNGPSLSIKAERSTACTSDLPKVCVKAEFRTPKAPIESISAEIRAGENSTL